MTAYAPPDAVPESAKKPGDEPLPGYRLIEPLGRGGFGEVWKCEAPGGLHKAVKFVASDEANHSLTQEFDAFQQIKSIRHPFLLQLERVELTSSELIMVMELADTQLQERFLECRNAGWPGIPRTELLGYLADAAEALDLISVRHGLQHLDVKPANLFLICGRVKVGDYGLVRAETTASNNPQYRGFTPRYVAPEVLVGRVDPRSDQYSLALVYQELLTGTFAYNARTAQQMMLMHATAAPNLQSLPSEDQGPVALALSKRPDDRYQSCLAFIQALMVGGTQSPRHDTLKPNDTQAVAALRLSRVQAASGYLARPNPLSASRSQSDSGSVATPMPSTTPTPYAVPQFPVNTPAPLPGSGARIGLQTPRQANQGSGAYGTMPRSGSLPHSTRPQSSDDLQLGRGSGMHDQPIDLVQGSSRVQLTDALLKSVLPLTVLNGQAVVPAAVTGDWFVNTIMAAANGETDSLGRTAAGTWVLRFRSTHPVSVANHKLTSLQSEDWFDDIEEVDTARLKLKRYASTGLFGRKKKSGVEMDVVWPGGRTGEVEVHARLFGEPDAKFSLGTAEAIPRLFNEIKALLKSGDERRKYPRVPVNFKLTIHPMKDSGDLLDTVQARCVNLSLGGLALASAIPIPTRYAYIEFTDIAGVAGLAILTKLIRSQPSNGEHLFGGRFRTNL